MGKKDQDKLDSATCALFMMKPVSHKRPSKPTKKEMERKFKMKVDRKGNPSIQEVK